MFYLLKNLRSRVITIPFALLETGCPERLKSLLVGYFASIAIL